MGEPIFLDLRHWPYFKYFILFLLICYQPLTGKSNSLMDSVEVWKEGKNLRAICEAAKTIDEKGISLSACDKMRLFFTASEAAFDLYQPEDCLFFAKAGREIPYSQCRDSVLIMQLVLREAVGLNLLEHPEKEKSIDLTEQVIQFGERHQLKELQYTAYTHLGMMLNKSGEYQKAREWFLSAHHILEPNGELRRRAISLSNIALCDLNLNQFSRGLVLIDSAAMLAQKADSRNFLGYCYGLKSAFHKALGDEAAWESVLDKAIQLAVDGGNFNQAAMGMADQLMHFVEKGRFEDAVQTGLQILQFPEVESQFPNLVKNVYKDLFTAYQGIGQHDLAANYLQKYVYLKDSIDQIEFDRQIYELNLKYEVQEKDNKLLQHQLDLKNSRMMLGGALSGIAALSLLSFFIYWRNKYQKQVIHSLFQKERTLELEIQRLHSLYPGTGEDSAAGSQDEENHFKQLFLESCRLMKDEQLYLDPELDLNELIKRLNTNRRYLSQAINDYAVDGFRSFVNRYRVEHAKSLIWDIADNKSDLTLAKVWNHVGMNSIQNFYRVFKSMTGLTPKEYLDQVKLELSHQQSRTVMPKENDGDGAQTEDDTDVYCHAQK